MLRFLLCVLSWVASMETPLHAFQSALKQCGRLQISAIHHRMLAADLIIGHVLIRTDQLTEGRNELVLKSKAHVDTGVVSFCVSGLEWSQPRAGAQP